MIRYYCSGFDDNNAFGYGIGNMLKKELTNTKSIVYIPGAYDDISKSTDIYVPRYTNYFKQVGIEFNEIHILSKDSINAKELVNNASLVMLMGGDPFEQIKLCRKLDIIEELKNYKGVMIGYSAGAMIMSKYIIITPCSLEYPEFHIEEGLNLDNISIYPHNNTNSEIYPDILELEDETYKKEDLLLVANKYGKFYLLQDYLREDNLTDVSIIKSVDSNIEYYTENDGKIWEVDKDIKLKKLC